MEIETTKTKTIKNIILVTNKAKMTKTEIKIRKYKKQQLINTKKVKNINKNYNKYRKSIKKIILKHAKITLAHLKKIEQIKIKEMWFLCLNLYGVIPGLDNVKWKRDRIKSSRTVTNQSSSGGVAGQLENLQPPGKKGRKREKTKRERKKGREC